MKKKSFKYIPIEEETLELMMQFMKLRNLTDEISFTEMINGAMNCFAAYMSEQDIREAIDAWLEDDE